MQQEHHAQTPYTPESDGHHDKSYSSRLDRDSLAPVEDATLTRQARNTKGAGISTVPRDEEPRPNHQFSSLTLQPPSAG